MTRLWFPFLMAHARFADLATVQQVVAVSPGAQGETLERRARIVGYQ
jgi:hypothetical protein